MRANTKLLQCEPADGTIRSRMQKNSKVTDREEAISRPGLSLPGDVGAPPTTSRELDDGHASHRTQWTIPSVLAALFITNVLLVMHDRNQILTQTRIGNTNLARAVSERVEASIAEVDHVLGTIATQLDERPMTRDGLASLEPMLISNVARIDQLDGLAIYDASGAQIATSDPLKTPANPDEARPFLAMHRESPSTSAVLGLPTKQASSPSGWTLPLSLRIEDAHGRFEGVVLANISLEHIRRILGRFDIGGGAITLIANEHQLVRRPFMPSELGKPLSPAASLLIQQGSGAGAARSPIDGQKRLYSFESTTSYPITVFVAASKAEVLRNWWVASVLQTLWVIILCVILKRSSDRAQRALATRRAAESGLRKAHASLADANERLKRLAQFDELTKLPNRRYFDRRLARAFKSGLRDRQWLALVMIDVDQFKTYNDRYGHPAGDRCLATVAAALKSAVNRPRDFIARYGGEEIVMLLPGSDPEGARTVAEAARVAVLDANIDHIDSPQGRVTVSLGVAAVVPRPGGTAAELLQLADDALYTAKNSGRNRVIVSAGGGD